MYIYMNMNLDQAVDYNWRSTDTFSDIGNDESITETIKSEFDLEDEKHSDTSITEAITKKSHGDKNKMAIVVEEGLLNAMHNLQIASAKKICPFRNSKVLREHDKKIEKVKTTRIEDQLSEFSEPEIKNMNSKAMNLLSAQSEKTINQTSPLSSSKSRSQSNISVNHSPSKNVVKTISDTEDGIKLKEEKIKFFGIPVQMARTKRTQAAPFHFQNRTKKIEQSQKIDIKSASTCTKTLDTTSKIVSKLTRNNTKINKENKIPNNSTFVSRKVNQKITELAPSKSRNSLNNVIIRKSAVNASENKSRVNKENMSNNNIIASDGIKPKLIAISPKLHTDQRAKDRQKYDAKIKQRAIEIEEMRLRVEQKKREKEKLEVIAMRKKSQSKTKLIPEFKIPQRIPSRKPLKEPQSFA